MAMDAEYHRQYMRQRRMLNRIAESVKPGTTADDYDRYTLWQAARKLYGTLTWENWPYLPEPAHPEWEWDVHHIYQMCPHGRRYCAECGTTTTAYQASAEQWSAFYNRIESARSSQRQHHANP